MLSSQIISFIISMLAILNPASSLAVFLGMTGHKSTQERRQIAWVVTLTIFVVLLLITWTGIPILNVFGISLPAFEITGGLIILLRGLSMLHSKDTPTSQTAKELDGRAVKESIGVVPLGIPIIAGPGAMTNVIIFSQDFPGIANKIYISCGVLFVSLVVGVVLLFSTQIKKVVGVVGIQITTRVMGLLLAAIAMSLMTSGLKEIFPGWS